MFKRALTMCAMIVLAVAAGLAFAQQDAPANQGQPTPPMGPPEQMKKCAALAGNWTAEMQMRMAPDAPWQTAKGTVRFEMILDGGALISHYEVPSPDMPMPYRGFGLQTWDRETNQWQMTWTDNMAYRIALYTGPAEKDGKTVLTGEDLMGGVKYLGRITTFNEKPDSFDWLMETSMDGGKTWFESGKATYTRVK